MKKLLVLAIVVVSATMIACKDSKKKAFPLFSADSSTVESTTVTEKGATDTTAASTESATTTSDAATSTTTQDTSSAVSTQTTTDTTAATTETTTQESSATTETQTGTQESGSTASTTTTQDTGSTGSTTTQESTPTAQTPADQNKDTSSTSEFKYSTVKSLGFDLTIMADESTKVVKANINVTTDGEAVTASITDDSGKAAFTSTVSQTCNAIEIAIEHPDYVAKTVKVENIQDLATISRVIYLEKKKAAETVKDSDGDGVADDADQFPDDPKYIAAVANEYTIAFEDLYPNKGDADFNDLVVKFGIMEYINPQNKISKIVIRSKVLASGAGYKNQFYMNVLGKDYLLIDDPKGDLNQKWNSKENETFVDAKVHEKIITFENPIARTDIAPMPYDPFIMANSDKKNQVHLPFVTTKWTGKVLDTDKFPWAVLVPDEWMWPYESNGKKGANIFKAYPKFEAWYKSGGTEYKDWYSNPDTAYTFPVPGSSALTAYLLKNRQVTSIAAISSLIGIMIAAVVIINIRRRKLSQK